MRSSVQSSPSGCHDVYGVSHHTQRKLQPLVRTNTEGTPTSEPSPWMEWKISAIRNAGLFESLAAQQAGVALPAWPALGVRVVATVRHAEIQAELAPQLHDLRLRQADQRRVNPDAQAAFDAGLGRQIGQALEGFDVFRTAIRITGVVQRIHTDEDVRRFQHLGPCQRKRQKDGGEPRFYEPLQLSDVKTADLRIGILHHPSSWFSDVVRRAYVEPSLVRGFHFLLRGHEHNAHVEVPSGTSGHCAMISAGAAYDRREYPNGYNFVHLDLASGNGNVYLRKYDLVRGFQKDTSATGDDSPGLFPFSVPKRPSPVRLVEHIGAAPAELSVDLVKDCTDPDIRAALELYESRIPDDERFEAPDIVRWLREDQQQRSDGVAGPRDYFVVAKADSRVCGFTLLHYYQTLDLAFIAYLVAERGVAIDHGTISQRLLEKVAWLFANEEHLRSCKGFLLEVDDPTRSC